MSPHLITLNTSTIEYTAKYIRISALSIVASTVLVACGGSSGEGNSPTAQAAHDGNIFQLPANTIQRVGFVAFSTTDSPVLELLGSPNGIVSATGSFVDYGDVLDDAYLDSISSLPTADTCEVYFDSSDDSQDIGVVRDSSTESVEANVRDIRAGEALTIMTPAGSWPDLLLTEETYFGPDFEEIAAISYDFDINNETLSGGVPAGTFVTVPGDEFPAFNNVLVPEVERMAGGDVLNVVDGRLMPNTEITWTPASASSDRSFTTISVSAYTYYDQTNTEMELELYCYVTDDGQFSFPQSVRNLLTEHELPADSISIGRNQVVSLVEGNAALLVFNFAQYYYLLD